MTKNTNKIKIIKLENGDCVLVSWDVIGHLSGWIDSLFKTAKELPDLGILSPLILSSDETIYWHGGYVAPNVIVPMSYAMGEKFYKQYPGTRQVELASLICCYVSKNLMAKLPLPENPGTDVFVDSDYCLRALQLGFKNYATDEVIVQYAGAEASGKKKDVFVRDFVSSSISFKARWAEAVNSAFRLPVCLQADTGTPSGFSVATRGYICGLTNHGIKIYYEHLRGLNEEEDSTTDELVNAVREEVGNSNLPQIVWGQAPYFFKNSGTYKIGFTEFEGEFVPQSWVRYCNMMNEIWVPTNWDRGKFLKAGVSVPIYVVQQGVDPAYFHPLRTPMVVDAKEPFKFITSATWEPRKNLKNLIKAFQMEFSKDDGACLIIKTINLGLSKGVQEEIKEIGDIPGSANIYVREEDTPFYQLGSFYTMGDCFVLPTHGEGWGLPPFEALACGIPVITTGWGALNETLRDKDGEPFPGVHFIDSTMTIANTPYVYLECNRWAEPSIMHLRQLMRYVFDHKDEEKAKALSTSEVIHERFNWNEVMKPAVARLEEIYKKL